MYVMFDFQIGSIGTFTTGNKKYIYDLKIM